jgi:hypothetical protein
MTEAHRVIAYVIIGATTVFTLTAAGLAFTSGATLWFERARSVLLGAIVLQLLVGAIVYGSGHRPDESLHLIYGVVLLGALPLAGRFAAEAPPKPRAGVFGVAGVVMLLLLWRLVETGG